MSNGKGFDTGIAVFDLHYPEHDKKLWDNIIKLCKDIKPRYFKLGGDNLDMAPVSHWLHSKGQHKTLEGKRLKNDYDGFQKDILNKIDCPDKTFLIGNHEAWAYQAVDKNPSFEGLIEPEHNLDLRGWKIIPENKVDKLGKLHFIHGIYTNKYHSNTTIDIFNCNIIYGHCHTLQAFTRTSPVNQSSHMAMCAPCACTLAPDYGRGRPNSWLTGFIIFYIMPSGKFHAYPVIANKGTFVYGGKLYQ